MLRRNYKQLNRVLSSIQLLRVLLTNGKYENKRLCFQLENERKLIELNSSLKPLVNFWRVRLSQGIVS